MIPRRLRRFCAPWRDSIQIVRRNCSDGATVRRADGDGFGNGQGEGATVPPTGSPWQLWRQSRVRTVCRQAQPFAAFVPLIPSDKATGSETASRPTVCHHADRFAPATIPRAVPVPFQCAVATVKGLDNLPQLFAVRQGNGFAPSRFHQPPTVTGSPPAVRHSATAPTDSRQTRHNHQPWRSRCSDGFAPAMIPRRAL